jgi:ATP adenylyltransferase
MDKLWAPWRINYVQAKKKTSGGCIFCKPAKAQTVFRTGAAVCILNIYPYNNGHLMVAPRRHVSDSSRLSDAQVVGLFRALHTAQSLLKRTLRPDGFNIGINLGRSAGAGIPEHMHIHIVPRWNGDTNFMPVLNDTKIVSQSLKQLHKQLTDAYAKTDQRSRR